MSGVKPVFRPVFIDACPVKPVAVPQYIHTQEKGVVDVRNAVPDPRERPNGRFRLRDTPLNTTGNSFGQAQRRWVLNENKPVDPVSSMEDLVPGGAPPKKDGSQKVETKPQQEPQDSRDESSRHEPYVRASGRIDFGKSPRMRRSSNSSSQSSLNEIYRILGFTAQTDEQTKVDVVLAYRDLQSVAIRALGRHEADNIDFFSWPRESLKEIFYEAARRFHPDRNPHGSPEEKEHFNKANLAWKIIRKYRNWH